MTCDSDSHLLDLRGNVSKTGSLHFGSEKKVFPQTLPSKLSRVIGK